ncbi:hypothetical protein SPHINGOT1_260054 [Sphingomonas sp. T1]|nr:hypothetical protein SPHINGOT1_260054 [Sphingomonas sp. T1]
MHGPHHVAQKLRMTTCPCRSVLLILLPSISVISNLGARSPTLIVADAWDGIIAVASARALTITPFVETVIARSPPGGLPFDILGVRGSCVNPSLARVRVRSGRGLIKHRALPMFNMLNGDSDARRQAR